MSRLPTLTETQQFLKKCIESCSTYFELNQCSQMIEDYILKRFKHFAQPAEVLTAKRELEEIIVDQRCKIIKSVYDVETTN